jgi:replicative DNA helicase
LEELLQPAMDRMEAIEVRYPERPFSVPTGFADFDLVTGGGLAFGELTAIAGPPAVGKSSMALTLARACAITKGLPCALFSPESTKVDQVIRLMASEAGVAVRDIRSGAMNDQGWARIARKMAEVCESPLHLDDSSVAVDEVEQRVRDLKAKLDLKLIIVDSFDLVAERTGGGKDGRRPSRQLKLLAKELELAVVVVAQTSVMPAERFSRPSLADIKDGSVVEDSDVVILLHRPDVFDRDDPRAGEADLIVAKNRHGPTFTISIAQQLHYGRFAELSQVVSS